LARPEGRIPRPAGRVFLPGYDICGEIVEAGREVTTFNAGEQVLTFPGSGGRSRFCSASADRAA